MGRVVGHWKERLTSPTPPRTLHFLLASRPTNYVADSDCRNVCFPFSPPQLRVHGACVMWPDGSKYTGEGTGMEGKGNQIDPATTAFQAPFPKFFILMAYYSASMHLPGLRGSQGVTIFGGGVDRA